MVRITSYHFRGTISPINIESIIALRNLTWMGKVTIVIDKMKNMPV